jgi:uncharacterized protein YqeY
MTILNQINEEIISCYKSGESEKRIFLQTIKSLLLNEQKEKREDLNDNEEIAVLKGELKKLELAISQYESGSRDDLVQKTSREVEILKQYLPEEMSDEKIKAIIEKTIASAEDKSFGSIMGAVMKELSGRADGTKVAQIVREQIKT